MNRLLFLFVCAFILSVPYALPAQEWLDYTSANDIHAIAEEGDHLWLASATGLVRFNKKTFTTEQIYTKVNSGLPSVWLTAIAVDRDGNKWIGSDRGVTRFDGSDWTTWTVSNSPLTADSVTAVFVASDNAVWVATRNEVARFDGDQWRVVDASTANVGVIHEFPTGSMVFGVGCSFPTVCGTAYSTDLTGTAPLQEYEFLRNTNVAAIAHRGDDLWFAANTYKLNDQYNSRLVRYNGTETTTITDTAFGFSYLRSQLTALAIDSSGGLWAADLHNRAIIRSNGTGWEIIDSADHPAAARAVVHTIVTDSDGVLWLASQLQGLLRYDGESWSHNPSFGLPVMVENPGRSITSLAVDADQSIWLGSQSAQYTAHFTGTRWYTQPIVYPMFDLAIDGNGVAWVTAGMTPTKLYRRAAGDMSWEDMDFPDPYSMFIDRNNALWVGSSSGVTRFDESGRMDFTPKNSGIPGFSVGITQGRDGAMWFCTEAGLVRFHNDQWTTVPYDDQIFPPLHPVCDSTGALWMEKRGFTAPALLRYDGEQWESYDTLGGSVPVRTITGMLVDRNGTLWIATHDDSELQFSADVPGGLAGYRNDTWTMYSTDNSPLPSNKIGALAVDTHNNLWIGTPAGLLTYREGGIVVSAQEYRAAEHRDNAVVHPNPASSLTTISYTVPEGAQRRVRLVVYNALGAQAATLVDRVQAPGVHAVQFDTGALPAGVYYYTLQTGGSVASGQMVVVK